jgi:hypothetical protein
MLELDSRLTGDFPEIVLRDGGESTPGCILYRSEN